MPEAKCSFGAMPDYFVCFFPQSGYRTAEKAGKHLLSRGPDSCTGSILLVADKRSKVEQQMLAKSHETKADTTN